MTTSLSLAAPLAGGRRRGMSVKTLKRALKKAGLKTSGRKAALTRRAKKAHLLRGGVLPSRSNADGVKPGDEDTKPSAEPMSSSSSESGLSNKTPEPSSVEAPFTLPSRSGGRHRRGHRSRKH